MVNSKELISTVYADLQPLLQNDLHYWLQRAKSIYRMHNTNESLFEAYSYAKKAYLDGDQSLKVKAALTAALITCALGEKVDEPRKLDYYEEAVNLAHEAVFSEYFQLNPRYLRAELPIGQNAHSEQRITQACNYVKKYSINEGYVEKSEDILREFDVMQKKKK